MKIPTYKEIWLLSYPIIFSLFAENIINITDTMFLARVGEAELGASAIGGTFYVILFIIGLAFSIGTQIIISRRLGENKPEKVGIVMEVSMLFLFVAAVLILIIVIVLAPYFFRLLISTDAIYEQTLIYVKYRIWGIVFTYLACAFRAFYTGVFRTKYLAINSVILAGVNIVFAYVLIFGKMGFPEMGIAGAGLASVIAEAVSMIYFFTVTLKTVDLRKYRLFQRERYDLKVIRNILDVSGFIILQNIISLLAWFGFFVIIEHRGQQELAITNIVRSIYIFFMIPGWAYGSATSTLVSNIIGQGNHQEVIRLIVRIAKMCFVTISVLLIPAVIFYENILSLYTSDPVLASGSVNSLIVVGIALIVFSLTMNFYSGVIGTGKTRMALYIEIFGTIIYMIYLYFSVIVFLLPIHFAWLVEVIYFIVIFALSYIYLKSGRWKKSYI